jgi:hypothetical protein
MSTERLDGRLVKGDRADPRLGLGCLVDAAARPARVADCPGDPQPPRPPSGQAATRGVVLGIGQPMRPAGPLGRWRARRPAGRGWSGRRGAGPAQCAARAAAAGRCDRVQRAAADPARADHFAASAGVTVGVLLGAVRPLSSFARPVLEVLRPIPGIAWIPLAIVWFEQRAELARALAVSPRLLLMDEPSAALDALTRVVLQEELSRLRAHHDTTFVMITHDVQEAVFLSDQVLVMSRRPGRVKRIVPVERDRGPAGRWRSSVGFTALCEGSSRLGGLAGPSPRRRRSGGATTPRWSRRSADTQRRSG